MKNQGTKRFTADLLYGTAGLIAMNGVLTLFVYPFLTNSLGDSNDQMLFYTAIMGLMASAFGSGANYARMKIATLGKTENGEYNRFLVGVFLLVAAVVFIAMRIQDAAGAGYLGLVALIAATVARYYADVQFRLDLNYKRFFCYYMLIAAGYVVGRLIYPFTQSWVLIILCGEIAGLIYVVLCGTIFKRPFFAKTTELAMHTKMMFSLSAGFLMSDFVLYTDRIFLPILVSGNAATKFFIATQVGKMASLLSTPLNGVIAGHLTRYEGKFTRKLFSKVVVVLLLAAVIITVGATVGSHVFVLIMKDYKKYYNEIKSMFILASAGQVLFFLANTLMVILIRFAIARYQLYVGIIYTVLVFAIVLPAIMFYGIWGAAWGLFAVNMLKFLLIAAAGFYAIKKQEQKEG